MIKEALPKIGRTNLFNIKKSSSQIFLKKENLNKAISSINLTKNKSKNKNKRTSNINKHEFIIAKKKVFIETMWTVVALEVISLHTNLLSNGIICTG